MLHCVVTCCHRIGARRLVARAFASLLRVQIARNSASTKMLENRTFHRYAYCFIVACFFYHGPL